jgi:alpha/beta hydrolase fold
VPLYFARKGMVGVNATYRLAPAAKWPAAAEDVKVLVAWLKSNAARFGGDPNRIYLIGRPPLDGSCGETRRWPRGWRQRNVRRGT